ncbi:unnamed protein product [Coregonus sp. 'balchen']|nr:unnamed protein product [Coregonus sp. 'balchen']
MAASTGGSSTASLPAVQRFPIITGRPPEASPGKDPEQTGEPKKKPCRACTDFKSWMKVQKTPQSPAAAASQVSWVHHGEQPGRLQQTDMGQFIKPLLKVFPIKSVLGPAEQGQVSGCVVSITTLTLGWGKQRFDCSRVDERWRDGGEDGSCD